MSLDRKRGMGPPLGQCGRPVADCGRPPCSLVMDFFVLLVSVISANVSPEQTVVNHLLITCFSSP